ncbi:MAG: MnhB domain-containing protein [Candidatus Dormibacteria bacterium]
MSPPARLGLFGVAGTLAALAILWGLLGLPDFGHVRSAYGRDIDRQSVPQQRITDAVTAVNFDYRASDTIGEEFILLVSVMSVTVLLRHLRSDAEEAADNRALSRLRPTSEAVRVWCIGAVGPMLILGIYVVSHGQLTPGGGFQGGAILASALVLLLLAGEFKTYRRVSSGALLEAAGAVGAGGFVAVGMAGIVFSSGFLANTLPLGQLKAIDSGGMVGIISALVGLEVVAGLAQIAAELAEHATALRVGQG